MPVRVCSRVSCNSWARRVRSVRTARNCNSDSLRAVISTLSCAVRSLTRSSSWSWACCSSILGGFLFPHHGFPKRNFCSEAQMVQPTATIRTANTDTRLISKCCGVSQLGSSMTWTSCDVGSSRRKDLMVPSPLPSRRQMPRASMRPPIRMPDRRSVALRTFSFQRQISH